MVKRIAALLSSLPPLLALVLFLAEPAKYSASVLGGVSLWAACVLPATFPFLFLTSLLTRRPVYRAFSRRAAPLFQKVFAVSGAGGGAAVLSAVSGYPVGARTTLDLWESGAVGKEELFRVACLASTTGPMFLVGAVGSGMFRSAAAGWVMLACHYAAVYLVCFLLRLPVKKTGSGSAPLLNVPPKGLFEILSESVLSILCVGGSIALFYAFSEMAVSVLPPLSPFFAGLVKGLFEMTAGCKAFAAAPSPLSMAMCAFFVTFGGMCVLVQQLAFLTKAGVKPLPFLLVKLAQGALAGALCYALSPLLF